MSRRKASNPGQQQKRRSRAPLQYRVEFVRVEAPPEVVAEAERRVIEVLASLLDEPGPPKSR